MNRGFRLSRFRAATLGMALLLGDLSARANSTNDAPSPVTAPAPTKLDESAFRIVSDRNIFNANRSGGTVRSTNTRRPARVETFALVGTMTYEKGVFAFFEGSSSEFTKALKPDGVIAGYKVVDILANAVKLEIDGKITELPVGSGMRREDQGTWKVAEVIVAQASYNSGGSGEANGRDSRSGRSRRGDNGNGDGNRSRESSSTSAATPATSASAGGDQSEVLKRLMERREKEE